MDDHQAYPIKHVQSEDWPISINSGTFHEEDPSPALPSSSSVCSGSARAFPTPPNQDEPLNYNSHLHTPTQYGLTKETSLPQANMNAQNNSKKFEGLRQHPSEARIDSSAQIRDLYNRDNETPFGSPLLGKSTVSMSVLHSSGSFSGSFRALKNAAEPSINTEVAWRRLRTHLHDEFEDTELVLLDWTTLHSVVRHIGITDPLEIARIQIAWRQRQQRYLMLPVPQRSSHPGISELEPTFPISQPKRERSVVNASASGVSLGNALTKSQSFRSGSNDRGRELGRTLSLSTATTHALLHGKLSVKTAEKSISEEATHVNDNSCAMESHHDGIRVNDVVRTNSYYAPYGTASARTSVDEEEGIRPYESVKPVVAQNHHYTSQRTREASVDAHAPVRHQRSMTKSQSQRQRVVVSNSNDSHHDALRSDQSLTPPDGALSRLQSGVTRTNTTSWGSALRSISNLHPTSSQTHKSPMRTSGTMSSLQQRSPPQRKKAASRDVSPLMHVVPRRNFTSNTTTTTTVHRGIASDAPVVGSTRRFGALRGGRLGQYSHSPQLTTSNNISNFSGHVRKDIHRKR